MKIICGIYKITSPTNKIYIGQSKNIYKRWNSYKSLNCKSQPYLYNSLRKHKVKNHKFEIICECEECCLLDYEEDYIYLFNSNNPNCGLNVNKYSEQRLKELTEEKRIANIKLEKKRKYNREYNKRKQEKMTPKTDEEWNEILRDLPNPIDELYDNNFKLNLTEEDLKNIPF